MIVQKASLISALKNAAKFESKMISASAFVFLSPSGSLYVAGANSRLTQQLVVESDGGFTEQITLNCSKALSFCQSAKGDSVNISRKKDKAVLESVNGSISFSAVAIQQSINEPFLYGNWNLLADIPENGFEVLGTALEFVLQERSERAHKNVALALDSDGVSTVQATNGHLAFVASSEIQAHLGELVLFSPAQVAELGAVAGPSKMLGLCGHVKIEWEGGSYETITPNPDGFPPVAALVGQATNMANKVTFTVDLAELKRSLRLVGAAKDVASIVPWDECLSMVSDGIEQSATVTIPECRDETSKFEPVSFSIKYLDSIAKAVGGDAITLKLGDPLAAILIEGSNAKCALMPIRS